MDVRMGLTSIRKESKETKQMTTTDKEKIAHVLEDAADVLEKYGYVQFSLQKDGKYCPVGAIRKVVFGSALFYSHFYHADEQVKQVYEDTFLALASNLNLGFYKSISNPTGKAAERAVIIWSDNLRFGFPFTRQQRVIRKLRQVAKKVRNG